MAPSQPLQPKQQFRPLGSAIPGQYSLEECILRPINIGGEEEKNEDGDTAGNGANVLSTQAKQLERQEKQKLREMERMERERKKEEERRAKKEERERKDRERQAKREQLEKEKEQKREEERVKREEKKRKLDEEKARKDAERRKKEEERKAREEEKRKKDEMKERSQMKISSFFSVKNRREPKNDPVSSPSPASDHPRSSQHDGIPSGAPPDPFHLYHRQFLPFFVKKNASMAPSSQLSPLDLESLKTTIDASLQAGESGLASFFSSFPVTIADDAPRVVTSEDLVQTLDTSVAGSSNAAELLRHVPRLRYLQFYENAKPPYVGTWCSSAHLAVPLRIRDPLDTSLTGYDYDYDSDLDWQEGDDDEGEDLDDDEDGDGDEDDANDDEEMDGFVEDNADGKRRIVAGPIQPITKWNDGTDEAFFAPMGYQLLQPNISWPLDPARDYWNGGVTTSDNFVTLNGPFSVLQLNGSAGAPTQPPVTTNILTAHKPTIQDPQVVLELKAFIEKNNDFSIGTLSELAKKEFKNFTKSMLKHTIQDVAVYNKKKSVWELKLGI